ncbi:MAG TPA: hypothetical protein VFS21_37620 [Roseiflexaceae bacterium]|nr:hypothetical protein [Roseiflexaceae bacterium]
MKQLQAKLRSLGAPQPSAVDVAAATIGQALAETWRNWVAYVDELRDLHAAQRPADDPAADLTGSGPPPVRRARLDAATRQEFGAILEGRRQTLLADLTRAAQADGRPAPTADQAEAQLLTRLHDELHGRVHRDGLALVFYQGRLMEVNIAALGATTTDADYLAAGARSSPSPWLAGVALVVGVIVIGIAAAILIPLGFGTSVQPGTGVSTVRVATGSVETWTVSAVQLGAVVDRAPVLRGGVPLTLCVADARPLTLSVPLVLTSTTAVRQYEVVPADEVVTPDLEVADCAVSPPRVWASALLRQTHTHQRLDTTLLRSVRAQDATTDPDAIPTGQMAVTLEVALPEAETGVLVLADGRRWSASTSTPTDGGTLLTYLVPAAAPGQQPAQPAGWELERPGELPALLSLQLPAPEGRAELLRRSLTVDGGAPVVVREDGVVMVSVPLTITLAMEAAPLALRPADLVVTSGGAAVEARWTPPALQLGVPTTVVVRVPFGERRTLELALAAWRARVTQDIGADQ